MISILFAGAAPKVEEFRFARHKTPVKYALTSSRKCGRGFWTPGGKRLRFSISHAVSAVMSQALPEQVVDLEEEEEEEEVSVLPSQTVSSVEQGPLAILSQEETIRMAQQSDTGESYGRADVQDSDSETDVASEELGPPLTQQFVDTEGKLPSSLSTPTLRPEDIEFPDFLRWVARNSNFDATSPTPKSDEEVLFESEVRPDPRDSDFLQLSPSPAIRTLAERRSKEAHRIRRRREFQLSGRSLHLRYVAYPCASIR